MSFRLRSEIRCLAATCALCIALHAATHWQLVANLQRGIDRTKMRTLAIETSSLYGSVAVLDGQTEVGVVLRTDQRSAQSLLPAIQDLLSQVGWQPADIELIGVTEGPGSFTGLRVGITVAKTLAYSCAAEVLGINTLEVIAMQAPLEQGTVTALLDAQRRQLFTASFLKADGALQQTVGTHIVDIEDWSARLEPESFVTGAGLRKTDAAQHSLQIVEEADWEPMATTVGRMVHDRFSQGARATCWELAPRYYRQSAAEEKLQQKDS